MLHGAAAGLHLMITFDATFADTDLAMTCRPEALSPSIRGHEKRTHSSGAVPALVTRRALTPQKCLTWSSARLNRPCVQCC
jgi:GntR family transcriptional regulator/MocR family aminotransferase